MNREEIATFETRIEIIKKNRNEFMDETIKLSGENKDFRKQLKAAKEERDAMQRRVEAAESDWQAAEKEAKAGKRLYIDAQKRCKAQALRGDTLEAENEQLEEQLAHWMGEGEPESPEDIEYRKLISIEKRSPEETKRLRKLIQIITEQGLEWWKRKYYQVEAERGKLRKALSAIFAIADCGEDEEDDGPSGGFIKIKNISDEALK